MNAERETNSALIGAPLQKMPLASFINVPSESDFPIQNLPYGIFKPREGSPRAGVALGDLILDLSLLEELGHFRDVTSHQVFSSDSLNAFMALGRSAWKKTRDILQHLLSAETATLRDNAALRARLFHKQGEVTMQLPARIGDYTDFYSSYHHAHNVGTMLRGPDNALMPNWKWLPVAYHDRPARQCARAPCQRRRRAWRRVRGRRGPTAPRRASSSRARR